MKDIRKKCENNELVDELFAKKESKSKGQGLQPFTIWLNAETIEKIKTRSKEEGLSQRAWVEKHLEDE